MTDDFDAAFAILDSYESFALLGMAFGQAKLYFETDLPAYEVQEYLERNGIRSDCWQMSDGVWWPSPGPMRNGRGLYWRIGNEPNRHHPPGHRLAPGGRRRRRAAVLPGAGGAGAAAAAVRASPREGAFLCEI